MDSAVPVSLDARRAALGRASMVLAVLIWGWGSVFIKISSLQGVAFGFYRLWLGFLVMLVALVATRRKLTARSLRASAPGGLLFALDVALFFSAIKLTSIADATIIGALQPALVLVVAGPWFGERVGRREVALTVVSMGGVALVAIGSAGSPVWSLTGDTLAALALLSWTGYWLVSKRVRSRLRINALEYMTGVMLVAAIVVTPVALLSGQSLRVTRAADWLWIGSFVLFPAAFGQLLVAWAHRYVEVWMSSLFLLGMPVVAAVAALVVLGEPISLLEVLGGIVVLAATAALVLRNASKPGSGSLPEAPASASAA